jgi:N-acetylglutamate synthase-like GNAT family acetyltransferase
MGKGPQDLQIRPFRVQDQQSAREIILSGLKEHFGTFDDSLNLDLEDIGQHYLKEGHDFIVAEWRGRLVGTGALIQEGPETGRLARLSVNAGNRRQGIGSALVGHLLQLARQHGFRRVLVETNHDWREAGALYQRLGFQEYGSDHESIHLALELA